MNKVQIYRNLITHHSSLTKSNIYILIQLSIKQQKDNSYQRDIQTHKSKTPCMNKKDQRTIVQKTKD